MLNEVMLKEAHLQPSWTSTMELFYSVKSYTYTLLHNSPFREKTYNWKLREKKFFVNNRTFFFRNLKLHNGMVPSINRSSHQRCSIRKGVLRNFAKFTVFLWILWNFLEHLFYRTPLCDCFWIKKVFKISI